MRQYDSSLDSACAVLADPTRRAVVARLCNGELSVVKLAEPLDMSLSAVGQDGIDTSCFGFDGDPVAESFGRFLNIDPPHWIVSAGVMRSARTGEVSSATLMTLHLEAKVEGTRLTPIDQSVFLGKGETADTRRHGWDQILDKLERYTGNEKEK